MSVSNVKIDFVGPALPRPPELYDSMSFDTSNNILRLYFNNIDESFRKIKQAQDALESLTWFVD